MPAPSFAAFGILALSVQASRLAGQQPTAADVQQRLQEDVGLAELVRQRIISQSGLTESQIRTQLQAAGYPTTLLDQYLQADTVAEPGSDVLRALALLGLGDGSLTAGGDSTLALDSATRDSLRADSLGLFDSIPALPVRSQCIPPGQHRVSALARRERHRQFDWEVAACASGGSAFPRVGKMPVGDERRHSEDPVPDLAHEGVPAPVPELEVSRYS